MSYIEEAGKPSFTDLIDLTKSFSKNLGKNKSSDTRVGRLTKSSIMKASKDLVLSFPVLCSNTVSPQTAMMITKAIERNCVTTLQLLFASSYLNGADGQEVLKKWHSNMDADFSMDDYLDTVDAVLQTIEGSNMFKEQAILKEQFLSDTHRYPLSSFSESSIDSFAISENYRGEYEVRREYVSEADNKTVYRNGFLFDKDQAQIDQNDDRIGLDAEKLRFEKEKFDRQQSNTDRDYAANQQRMSTQNIRQTERDRKEDEYNRSRLDNEREKIDIDQQNLELQRSKAAQIARKDQMEYFNKQLMDSDVKKANELVPSMIIVQYDVIDPSVDRSNMRIEKQFIAGVKARLIPCDSMEIIDHVAAINKTKPSLVNLVRATSGEIKFARDFIFAIDQAKIDAKVNTKLSKTSPIWRSLQARSTKSGLNRLKKNKANDAGAITTLVLTTEEVNMIKKEYNFDLYNISKARYLMETYNLMTLVIVDEEIEIARFLLDGEKYYQDYSFNTLERETGDGSYKKVINLISKINRG